MARSSDGFRRPILERLSVKSLLEIETGTTVRNLQGSDDLVTNRVFG